MNNLIVDSMDYLEFDFNKDIKISKHGQTSDIVSFDIRLDDGNSSTKHMDVFVLKNKTDQECYEIAMSMQDWTRECEFMNPKYKKDDAIISIGNS